ncbi:MAG TPA: adenylate/guanylate cyclase domain-containing protein, partial [Anaerolineae bacterium]
MSSRQELEQAIVALEAQRAALGDDVVDMAVAVLREKLASRQGYPLVAQHEQTTVLVADLSGFTALSEWRDAEEVRDTMNAVWQKLDSVIESWEGNIDKHVGDGVIALFGVPDAREDDVERAIRAALDMQMELALFNEQTGQEISQDYFSRTAPPAELRMRIGIHTGPVLFGRVGTGEEHTAIGDTVIMANQLERLAPVGGILISHAVYRQVHALFDVQPLELSLLDGVQEPSRFYVVKRDKPGVFRFTMRGIEGVSDGTLATRLVGRTEELQRLQDALQTTIDSGVAQVMTVAGEAGVGKSRLLYEFERLLALLPEPVCLFKGRVHQVVNASPYGLVRDVFVNYFDIHRRSSAAVAREKLVRGVMDAMEEEGARARERAHFIGHLLGFNFAGSPYLLGIQNEARRIREYGFQDVAHFFKGITKDYPAAVLLLEDIHQADEGSFDLIDYLVQECHHVPMLIVCLARPSLFEKRPSWHLVESLDPAMYQHLELQPLSAIDSRHLVADILRHVANVPLKLSDLIVNSAGGNPFYIEELIKVLIEEGVVIKGPERWRVDLGKLTDVPAPAPLATLLQSRLDRLTLLERRILEEAAVVGRVFWDTLLLQLGQTADVAISHAQLKRVLGRLGEIGWIYQRRMTTF